MLLFKRQFKPDKNDIRSRFLPRTLIFLRRHFEYPFLKLKNNVLKPRNKLSTPEENWMALVARNIYQSFKMSAVIMDLGGSDRAPDKTACRL